MTRRPSRHLLVEIFLDHDIDTVNLRVYNPRRSFVHEIFFTEVHWVIEYPNTECFGYSEMDPVTPLGKLKTSSSR